MGAADVVPGISGGTIALITGIYQRLIDAIDYIASSLNKDFFKRIKGIDYSLLVPLFLGIG